jgi:hypothetical protein
VVEEAAIRGVVGVPGVLTARAVVLLAELGMLLVELEVLLGSGVVADVVDRGPDTGPTLAGLLEELTLVEGGETDKAAAVESVPLPPCGCPLSSVAEAVGGAVDVIFERPGLKVLTSAMIVVLYLSRESWDS